MKKSTKILIPTVALSIFTIAGAIGIESTFAQEEDGHISIVQRIAQRFNLSESDVQSVFDEERDERQVKMQQRQEEKLDQLVSEGKITEEQKSLIVAKWEEMRTEREENMEERRETKSEEEMKAEREKFKNMTDEERQAEMEARKEEREEKMNAEREELESWLEEKGISKDLLPELGFLGGGPRGGHAGPGGFGGPALSGETVE